MTAGSHRPSDRRIGDAEFDRFIDDLMPSPEEISAARHAAGLVVAALRPALRPGENGQGRSDFLVIGSIGKRTAIRPLPAVDLLTLLPLPLPPHHELAALLKIMETALRQAFPQALVEASSSFVAVCADGLEVRAYPSAEGRQGFAFPLDTGWTLINPVAEMAAIRLADAVSGGVSTRLLTLLKAWRTSCQVALPSFALELMVRDFLGQNAFTGWAACLSDFLAWSRQKTARRYELPGSQSWLEVGDAWHPAAEAAYWRCVLASRHDAAGDHAEAIEEWRKLLGRYFAAPSPFNIWKIPQDLGP